MFSGIQHLRMLHILQDSYTDGGKEDGSPLPPPVLVPPSPLAGGRSTNGYTWVELVAFDVKATIMDYAVSVLTMLRSSHIFMLIFPFWHVSNPAPASTFLCGQAIPPRWTSSVKVRSFTLE